LSDITFGYVWKNEIQRLMILYFDVTAAGEQIRRSKLSVQLSRKILLSGLFEYV